MAGPEFRQVALTTDRRGGVLSQAAVLTVSSYPTRTSPVIRGKDVLQNILGMPPPAPPPDVPSLPDKEIGQQRSMREQLEADRHRIRTLVHGIVRSLPFEARRGDDAAESR